jgi:hypothetical protein
MLMCCILMRRHANRFYEGTHWSLKFYESNESKKEKNGESVSVFLFCALTQITAIIFDHSRKNET